MDPIPLPAPYLGAFDQVPVAALQSPYCQEMLNFNIDEAGASLRKGDALYKSLSGAASPITTLLTRYGDTKAFLVVVNGSTTAVDIYDVDAGTSAYNTGPVAGGLWTSLYFNKYLFLFHTGGASPGVYYNGSTYGVIGYSGSGLTPRAGNVYRRRAYIIQSGDAAYWYSGIDAISGALTKVDLNTVVSEKCTLTNIASFAISESPNATVLQAFIFSNGEVLFYTGAYPNSTDWALAGRAKIGKLVSYTRSVVPYQSDALVLCDSAIFSLRDLFTQGIQQASLLSVNHNVEKRWAKIMKAARIAKGRPTDYIDNAIQGVWDQANNRILITMPFYLDDSDTYQTGNYWFVYNTLLKGWSFHQSFGATGLYPTGLTSYNNTILFSTHSTGVAAVLEKEGSDEFRDDDPLGVAPKGFDYDLISAPVSNGRAFVQKCSGMDFIMESDLYDVTDFQLIRDLGVEETSQQKLPADTPSSLQKPFVNLGIEGSYIQYRISGTTAASKSVGLTLYGSNFWVEIGESPR